MSSALTLCTLGIPIASGLSKENLLFDYASENYSAGNWTDTSGNGNTATQSDSSKRPSVESAALNGYPALVFDGSNDTLFLPSGINNVVQYFAVFRSTGSTWNTYGSVLSNSGGGTRIGGIFNPGSTNFYTDPSPLAVTRNTTDLTGFFDLAPINTYLLMTLKPANQTGNLQIGALENTFFGAIKLVRLAGYSAEKTGATLTAIRAFLMTQYGLS